jgi:adenine deaminase
LDLLPDLPVEPCTINVIRAELPGIVTLHRKISLESPPASWEALFADHDLCYVSVVERHGKTGAVARGFLQNLGLKSGAVASSVGHDAHNIIVAGTNEDDMRVALAEIKKNNGGVVVVDRGEIKASVALPVAGLISDLRAPEVAEQTSRLKAAWSETGCILPYMGFNLIPLSVIPEIRMTDKGLVTVPQMEIVPLVS